MSVTWSDRPFILHLLKRTGECTERLQEEKAMSKKRRRNYSRASSGETIECPYSPAAQPDQHGSPIKSKKRLVGEDVVDITFPSSDIEENEITIPLVNLAPKGTFSFLIFY